MLPAYDWSTFTLFYYKTRKEHWNLWWIVDLQLASYYIHYKNIPILYCILRYVHDSIAMLCRAASHKMILYINDAGKPSKPRQATSPNVLIVWPVVLCDETTTSYTCNRRKLVLMMTKLVRILTNWSNELEKPFIWIIHT